KRDAPTTGDVLSRDEVRADRRRRMSVPPHGAAAGRRSIGPSFQTTDSAFGKPVCRLGLASRGDSRLEPSDYHRALGRGVNFLNWPGTEDALSHAVAELGEQREEVVVCAQLEARTAAEASREL